MKFRLEIELGNDAMQTRRHVASALTKLAKRLVDERMTPQDEDLTDDGKVLDLNGSSVGRWEFTDKARIVIDDLPDPEENPSMKTLREQDLCLLMRDALGEFIDHRIPLREYVAKRYNYMSAAQQEAKVEEVSRRTTWAALIKQGDVKLEK